MDIENLSSIGTIIGEGFFGGVLIGYALKKVVKILAIVVGLFFAGLTYLQYEQIVNINWNKLQIASQNAVTTLANATTHIPGYSGTNAADHTTALAMTNFGIPLTGSMSMGFAIGFMKG
jgi:uncharacterized membrane protein (Fun14 family)